MSWLNLGTRILTYLGMVPLSLNYLHLEDFVAWQVFVSALALVFALDFGFSPTISRFIAYQTSKRGGTNKTEVESILNTSIKIYSVLGLFVFLLYSSIGYYFLDKILNNTSYPDQAHIAWLILSLLAGLQALSFYWTSYLTGIHKIPQVQLFQTLATLICSLLAMISLIYQRNLLIFTVLLHSAIVVNLIFCVIYKTRNIELNGELDGKTEKNSHR